MENVFALTRWHLKNGISIFPLPRGKKSNPAFKWKPYTEHLPSEAELKLWFHDHPSNYAVIGGSVSGNLVVLDFDNPQLVRQILGNPVETYIANKTTRIVKTAHGYHFYFRNTNGSIASKNLRTPKDPITSIDIDIKAEGGYVVGPGSLHPSGVEYELVCDIVPQGSDVRRMMEELIYPRIGYLILSRIIEPIYTPGIRYNLTIALGTYLYVKMGWGTDKISEFFAAHDMFLESAGMEHHRPTTIRWLVNHLKSIEKKDHVIGTALDDKTIRTIEKYSPLIDGHVNIGSVTEGRAVRDNTETTRMEYWFDDANGVSFHDRNLYKLTEGKRGVNEKLLMNVPIAIHAVVNHDGVMKVRYTMDLDDAERIDTVQEMCTHIAVNIRSTREDNKYLSIFLYRLIADRVEAGKVEVMHDPIYIDNGIIRVSYDEGHDVASILGMIRDFYDYTMNQSAYMSAFSFSLTAPLHYYIRKMSPPGFIVPYHVSVGRTGGSKTTTDSIFVYSGWDMNKDEAFLMANQVKKIFTLMKHVSTGYLPVIVNDVSSDWLDSVSAELKSASEAPAFGDRGKPNDTMTHSEIKRSLMVTMNADISASDDAARYRRYILEHYTADHERRKDMARYTKFIDSIPRGFMFDIFREIFDGVELTHMVEEIIRHDDAVKFIQYGMDKINGLCRKYNIPEFPSYEMHAPEEHAPSDSYESVCEYIFEQEDRYKRIAAVDHWAGPRPELGRDQFAVEDASYVDNFTHTKINRYNIWFTAMAYRVMAKTLGLPHRRVMEFIYNYVPNDYIKIIGVNVSKRNLTAEYPVRAYGIEYTVRPTDYNKIRAVRYIRRTVDHEVGDEDILPHDEAERRIKSGDAEEVK